MVPPSEDSRTPLYVVSDLHGHREQFTAVLREAGLIDDDERWTGGGARLWCLGDFTDRGPDGVGVIELVMDLAKQAEETGGRVDALLGNHEILLLGAHRYGEEEVPGEDPPKQFTAWWVLNGGRDTDAERLTDEIVEWLSTRDAVRVEDGHLLMHTDAPTYLNYGGTADEINAKIRGVLASDDLAAWWDLFRQMTARRAFHGEGDQGVRTARAVLDALGGERIVHGHSTIPDQFGVDPSTIEGPRVYCEGLALAVDGGVYQGGPCLLVKLPYTEE
ncbi:serine/threonine protein phosphatase [Actinorhabdospora filicis]|uniref:Serine/threonine protein phosphatase n=1 Tax=Actinorhabdospora filicis TaxID=1785913 RepID=A0A9W6W7A7_9ACTN|nr:metallophosphoesterase [Actinorhabdospora filicis]GLZ75758.1 serine/threonine protein phosphatase [Actinorhabdospora filicis]